MNCEDFESNVDELARGQMMEASIFAQAIAHGEECEACARRLEDQRSLSFKLSALAGETNSAKLPPMRNELVNALRSQVAAKYRPLTAASRRSRTIGGMAVAAMVLVVITATVIRSRFVRLTAQDLPNSSPAKPAGRELANVKTPDFSPSPPAPSPNRRWGWENRRVPQKYRRNVNPITTPIQSVADVSSKHVTVKETANSITPDSAAEITTDFMPVGYASATTLQDGGQLVRVELPRSALVAFGLPMNVNRYDEKVKADVFFSADGMARAIRFVQ